MPYRSPSITDLLIATIGSARSTKLFYSILRERQFKRFKKESIEVGISRLHKKGYLKNSPRGWSLSHQGEKYARNTYLLSYLPSPFLKNTPATRIISFDIPERDRTIRNWLRNQIKIFDYKMLQQSLWVGPGPLPDKFLERLRELNIRKKVKIFTITKKNI